MQARLVLHSYTCAHFHAVSLSPRGGFRSVKARGMLFMEKMSLSWLLTTALVVVVSGFTDTEPGPAATSATPLGGDRFKIEGRAIVPGVKTQDWVSTARVLVDGEDYVGFLR